MIRLTLYKVLFILSVLVISSCGPSKQEKEEIAILTCNIIESTRNMDAATRIKEINAARLSIGEERYLGGDGGIVFSLKMNLCPELVLNDPEYENKLKLMIKQNFEQKQAQEIEAAKERLRREEEAKKRRNEKTAEERVFDEHNYEVKRLMNNIRDLYLEMESLERERKELKALFKEQETKEIKKIKSKITQMERLINEKIEYLKTLQSATLDLQKKAHCARYMKERRIKHSDCQITEEGAFGTKPN